MYLRETLRMTHFQRKVVFQDPWAKLLKSKAKEGSWVPKTSCHFSTSWAGATPHGFPMSFFHTASILSICIPNLSNLRRFLWEQLLRTEQLSMSTSKHLTPPQFHKSPSALPDINCQPHMFSSPSSKLRSATPYFDDYPMWEVVVNHLQYTSLYIQQYFTAIKFKWSLEYRTQRSHWSDVHCNMGQSPRSATSGRKYFYTGCGWSGDPTWLSRLMTSKNI